MLPEAKVAFERSISIWLCLPGFMDLLDSKLAPEGPLQHSRQERVQLGSGLCLVALEGVELGLYVIDMGDNSHRPGLCPICRQQPDPLILSSLGLEFQDCSP